MILFISIFAGLSVFIFLMILIQKIKHAEPYQTKIRLQNLSIFAEGVRSVEEKKSSEVMARDWSNMSFTERILAPIISSVQNLFLKLAPRAILKTIERKIILAGKQNVWSLDKVIFSWGTVTAVAFFFGLMIFFMTDLLLIQRVTILLMLTTIGAMLPASYMRTLIKARQEKILTELPPFLDLLSVSVQAGLSFDASVDRILRHSKGALSDEFRQMQKDMRLGLSKKEALHEMAGRCDLEDIYLFTTSVIQAERLGTSMGKALVEQANNMRERYQQRIKTKALKAPIKILFPLILLIFPSVFIIILLPPLISVLNNLNLMP